MELSFDDSFNPLDEKINLIDGVSFININYLIAIKLFMFNNKVKENTIFENSNFRNYHDIIRLFNVKEEIDLKKMCTEYENIIRIEKGKKINRPREIMSFKQVVDFLQEEIKRNIDGEFLRTNNDRVIKNIKDECYVKKIDKERIYEILDMLKLD